MIKRRAIVFIDGNNWYHNCKKVIKNPSDVDLMEISKLIISRFDLDLVEVRYYNSVPNVFDKVYAKHKFFLDGLKEKGIKVFVRELSGAGKTKREKGIDVLIGVDVIKKVLIDNCCDVCIIISGDADFLPVIDLVKSRGKEVIVSSVYAGFSRMLRGGRFRYFILRDEDLNKCFNDKDGED